MALPVLIPAALRLLGIGLASGVGFEAAQRVLPGETAVGDIIPRVRRFAGERPRRRRARKRLTQSELHQLTQIKMILGKTAAANALPFFLGRGG